MTDTPNIADRTAKIRALNDQLRQNFHINPGRIPGPFKVLLTQGLQSLSAISLGQLLDKVAGFSAFDDGNDPHREHDFGAVDHEGERYFWKIDYYNRQLNMGSDDPGNSAVTVRVLTIMLASEY